MKKQKVLNLPQRSTFALAIWTPTGSQSAEHAKLMKRCQEMKEQKQKLKADMTAEIAELARYVARMKRAPEEKKMGLMHVFLIHMEERRIAMDERQAKMQQEITKHMILHMQMGRESMLRCQVIWGTDEVLRASE